MYSLENDTVDIQNKINQILIFMNTHISLDMKLDKERQLYINQKIDDTRKEKILQQYVNRFKHQQKSLENTQKHSPNKIHHIYKKFINAKIIEVLTEAYPQYDLFNLSPEQMDEILHKDLNKQTPPKFQKFMETYGVDSYYFAYKDEDSLDKISQGIDLFCEITGTQPSEFGKIFPIIDERYKMSKNEPKSEIFYVTYLSHYTPFDITKAFVNSYTENLTTDEAEKIQEKFQNNLPKNVKLTYHM